MGIYSLGENADITSFFYEVFWTALYVGFCAKGGDYSMIHPGLGEADLGWIPQGLVKLEEIARNIAEGRLVPTFSAIYAEAADLEPVQWGPAPERENSQYRAFTEALRSIAVDLHFLGLSDPGNTKVPASELIIARQSAHWSDTIWVTRNVGDRIPLLDKDGAAALLTDEAKVLSAKVTEFNERSGRWTELANLSLLYEDGRQADFLAHAAECLVGYGWRKDLHAMDVLDAVVELNAKKPAVTRAHIDTLVPIIEMITKFTDGDETNHVRSELIEVVAKVAPERLPALYKHHFSTDDYSYADECLIELAKIMDLESREGAALARTFLDERTLGVLEDRAVNEPAARQLFDSQVAFLGRPPKALREIKATKEEEFSEREKEAAKVDPASFDYKDFAAVAKAAAAVHYGSRKAFMVYIMAKTITTKYDVSEHLRTPQDMAAYVEACIEEANGDAAFIAKALGDIARAKGMSQVARDAGLSRESLYKALSGERSPGFDTILKVISALGLKLHAEARRTTKSTAQRRLAAER